MTYSTCVECKVSTLASIRNMKDVQNKKYSDRTDMNQPIGT